MPLMQLTKPGLFKALSVLLVSLSSFTVSAESAREIMERVDQQQRKAADATLSLSRLSSCPFAMKKKKVVCREAPRVKLIESVSRQLGDTYKDSKNISIILEPARERGVGMLTYSYDDSEKDTESWLYLSALGKVKRMASGSGEDQEPVSLFGSEFNTEDMESGKTDEYDYKIVEQGLYSGKDVWVIEAKPKPIRLRKTYYSRLLIWVDKARYVPLKLQTYDKYNKLYKRILLKKFEQNNGLWTARDTTIFNLKVNRLSNMKTEKLAMNIEVDDAFLTQRSLSDFAYRESNLQKLRLHF